MIVTADWQTDTSGSTGGIVFGLVDSSNYFLLTLKVVSGGSSELKLFEVSGGTPTLRNQINIGGLTVNTAYTLRACVNEDGQIFCSQNSFGRFTYIPGSITGTKAGLYATGSGTSTFDGFTFEKSYHTATAEACVRCGDGYFDCTAVCADDATPTGFTATLSAFSTAGGGGLDCNGCDGLDGVYVLTACKPCVYTAPLTMNCTNQSGLVFDHIALNILDFIGIFGLEPRIVLWKLNGPGEPIGNPTPCSASAVCLLANDADGSDKISGSSDCSAINLTMVDHFDSFIINCCGTGGNVSVTAF